MNTPDDRYGYRAKDPKTGGLHNGAYGERIDDQPEYTTPSFVIPDPRCPENRCDPGRKGRHGEYVVSKSSSEDMLDEWVENGRSRWYRRLCTLRKRRRQGADELVTAPRRRVHRRGQRESEEERLSSTKFPTRADSRLVQYATFI